jgi:hypothetical protein
LYSTTVLKMVKREQKLSSTLQTGASGKNDDKDPSAKVVSDSSKKEDGQRLFGLKFRNNDTLKYLFNHCAQNG